MPIIWIKVKCNQRSMLCEYIKRRSEGFVRIRHSTSINAVIRDGRYTATRLLEYRRYLGKELCDGSEVSVELCTPVLRQRSLKRVRQP